jgi:ribonuclease D
MREARLITTQAELEAAVFRLQGASRLALDTEFMRERTYYAQLCLVQLASDTDSYLVDPLAGLELGALYELLADRTKLKILHAARQDLEILHQAGGQLTGPIFDTQVAAAFLGYPPQVGYAELVARQLGHSIDKGQTRTDWSRRPLTPEQLAYAADDVHHLLELHDELSVALQQKDRAGWVPEETAAFDDPALYRTEPTEAWRRLKGLRRLTAEQQAAARALACWREERAIASDKPRGWILSDAALYAIATRAPRTEEQLAEVAELPPSVVRKRGQELIALLEQAGSEPPGHALEPPPGKPTPEETRLIGRLMESVREEAGRLGISPEVLATRRDVEALARGSREGSPLLQGWRAGVIGQRMLEALEAR